MPAVLRIAIRKGTQGAPPQAVFDPPTLQAFTLDQIFWTNEDDVAHWPGRLNADGSIDATFFMPNQIAPNGDQSAIWASANKGTFDVACSLHPDERGTIQVD